MQIIAAIGGLGAAVGFLSKLGGLVEASAVLQIWGVFGGLGTHLTVYGDDIGPLITPMGVADGLGQLLDGIGNRSRRSWRRRLFRKGPRIQSDAVGAYKRCWWNSWCC